MEKGWYRRSGSKAVLKEARKGWWTHSYARAFLGTPRYQTPTVTMYGEKKRGAPMGNCNAAKNKALCRAKAGASIKKQHDILRKYTNKMERYK